MSAATRLDTGLLIRRDHELVVLQRLAVPTTLIQIQDAARLEGKIRVAREDPGAMLPGTDGVFVQPSPNGAAADPGHQARPRDRTGPGRWCSSERAEGRK